MITLSVEGSIKIDPQEDDLDGRVKELMEDDLEIDEQEARREALGIILSEHIGHTGFWIEEWHEARTR